MRVRGKVREKSAEAASHRKVNALHAEILRSPSGTSPPSETSETSKEEALHEACRRDEPPEDDRRKNQIQPDAHERAKHSTFLSMMGATEKLVRP